MPDLDATTLPAARDHVRQWRALKIFFVDKRGSDPDRNGKAVPRTTNADALQLVAWWDREIQRNRVAHTVRSKLDRQELARWNTCRDLVRRLARAAEPDAVYIDNAHLWQTCTARLADFLEARKIAVSEVHLFFGAVRETVAERAADVRSIGEAAAALPSQAGHTFGRALWIGGALLGAAIVVPPLIRTVRR